MRVVKKVGVYLAMLIFAVVVAGIYGVLHDQISYSFSNEYFTQFKFKQFGVPWAYASPRLGAAYVGALATWWMGGLVFLLLGLFGFMFKTPPQMAINLSKSFVVVMIVAFITGLGGLAYGYYQINEATIAANMQWVRPGVTDPIQFVRVGYMHNASYMGGITGLLAGAIYLIKQKLRLNKTSEVDQ
jgi:hypothetical protein